ncbi:MAG: hypothetical protein HOV80_38515 [Polyangiaceae bacterium]|nr:hypothetical protein [Polyangiaceae bacterium]
MSTVAIASCATGSSDGTDDDDDDDGETIETKDGECTASQFDCGGGTCISSNYVCDGIAQCDDASDEPPINTECPASNCPPGEFGCSLNECIPGPYFCNGLANCDNGVDEPPGCNECALPDPTSPATCDEACNDVFDCGLRICSGDQLCSVLNPDNRATFISSCLTLCGDDAAWISAVNPTDCGATMANVRAVDPDFGAICPKP